MIPENEKLFKKLIGKARSAASYAIKSYPDKPKYGQYAYGEIAKTLAKAGEVETALELVSKWQSTNGRYRDLLTEIARICAENSDLTGALSAVDKIGKFDNERFETLAMVVKVCAEKNNFHAAQIVLSMIPTENTTSFITMERIIAKASIAGITRLIADFDELVEEADKLPFWAERSRAYAAIAEALLV